jgi:hypothetical protein
MNDMQIRMCHSTPFRFITVRFLLLQIIRLSREFSLNFPESVDRVVGGYLNSPSCRISAQLCSFDQFEASNTKGTSTFPRISLELFGGKC